MNLVKIVYFGTPEFSATILEKLIELSKSSSKPKFIIQTVVTSADKKVGRKQTLNSSVVSQVAQKYNITILKPEKLDEAFLKSHLSLLECDLFIVASYGKIIPQIFLDIPKLGALNVHGSILPKYRGASPIQEAIKNGDITTGITIMLMDQKMDHGPTLSTRQISISNQDTFDSLGKKMAPLGAELLIETMIKFIEGKVKPREQNHTQATFCKLIKKEDGYFDINNPPSPPQLDRLIRAYYPWPTVWTRFNNKIVKFLPEGLIQLEGKKPVKLEEFLRGYPDFPIKSLKF